MAAILHSTRYDKSYLRQEMALLINEFFFCDSVGSKTGPCLKTNAGRRQFVLVNLSQIIVKMLILKLKMTDKFPPESKQKSSIGS